jgi:hypothetical protein
VHANLYIDKMRAHIQLVSDSAMCTWKVQKLRGELAYSLSSCQFSLGFQKLRSQICNFQVAFTFYSSCHFKIGFQKLRSPSRTNIYIERDTVYRLVNHKQIFKHASLDMFIINSYISLHIYTYN